MLSLTLYKNSSEKNKVNKTLTEIITLEGSLLESTSVINPSIKIFLTGERISGYVIEDNAEFVVYNGVKLTFDSFIYDIVLSANYARIADFNRYYFITDIISIRRNIWQIELSCDVLMSYKDDFLKLKAFIGRNEFNYVMDAVDELRDFHYPKSIYYDQITHVDGFTPDEFNTNGFLLACVVADDASEQKNTPIIYPENISNNFKLQISSILQSENINLLFYDTNGDSALLKAIYTNSNLQTFVKYLKAFPFYVGDREYYTDEPKPQQTQHEVGYWTRNYHIGDKHDIYVGDTPTMPKYNVLVNCMADFKLDDFIGYSYTDEWLKSEPYTTIELWVPFYNFVKLPYVKIHNHELRLYYITTIGDGSTTAIIYDVDDDKILFSSKVECSVDIPTSTTNNYENEKKKDALITSTAIGTLSSILSIGFGVGSANPMLVASGVMGGVSTVTKAVTSASQIYETANVGSTSVTSGIFNSLKPFIKRTVQTPISLSDEAEYNHLFGKPLKNIRTLSDLHGFTKVDDIMIENISNITKNEEETLIALLKEGIVL